LHTAPSHFHGGVVSESRIIIVGAGPAGLTAAEALASAGRRVSVYDQAPSPARKFLMAGRGGLNLTHTEPLEMFIARYGAAAARMQPALDAFSPQALRDWSRALGEPTFVGTSGRVFPNSFKASPLLRAWLRRLVSLGVTFNIRHRFDGFDEAHNAMFSGPQGSFEQAASAVILACGGASWPRLGSDGGWVAALRRAGVEIADLRSANCGFLIDWSQSFKARFAGRPLKSLALDFRGARSRGEAMITQTGIEGGAIYALSALVRASIDSDEETIMSVDLKPDVALDALTVRLARSRKAQSFSTFLRKATGLSPVAIALLREAGSPPLEAQNLAERIKRLPLRLTAAAPIARAISSAGGVKWSEVDGNFMLRRLPGVFVAGEMIDWEAPTGGYLLQGSFATGLAAARGALQWLER
jgi:uncharacterized flavoprotein (TIGR03862 family)